MTVFRFPPWRTCSTNSTALPPSQSLISQPSFTKFGCTHQTSTTPHYVRIMDILNKLPCPSATFQDLMNDIFRPLMSKSVLVFFDDILVYSPTWETHLQHVREVLGLIQKHRLSVKFKKFEFGKQELEYLGHIISHKGVAVDHSKIKEMTDWPAPTTVTELRGFLGLTGYGLIARPLTNLL